jgi:hypothetical protein
MNETGWFGQSLAESPGWTLSAVGSEFQLNALGSSFSCTASQPWAGSEGWAAPKEKEEAKRAGGQVASSWRWRTDLFPFFFLQIKVVRGRHWLSNSCPWQSRRGWGLGGPLLQG